VDRSEVQVLRSQLRRQIDQNDCGLAALATVAAHHGRRFDQRDWSNELTLDRDGTDLLSLSRIAESLGFEARGVRASYDAIAKCRLPAIAHWRRRFGGGHFVVVHRWTSRDVIVADPAVGLRRLSRRAFCRRSSGYFLLLEPVGPTPP
jgi:ABC-type bacteriocin/lantibiotic exporter with double-glycine peptidase domain